MNTQVYVGILVFLFILLLLGWSKTLFWFLAGGVIGVVGLKMYESEMLERLSRSTDIIDEINIAGVWSPHKTILIEKGREKQLVIPNTPVPREKVAEVSTGIFRNFNSHEHPTGISLEVILCPRTKSNKGMLYGPGNKPTDYYLDLMHAKKDEYGKILGYYSLRKDVEPIGPQIQEKHTVLLEKLKGLIGGIFNGKKYNDVALLAASHQQNAITDEGILSLFNNAKDAQFYQIQSSDITHGEEEQRGIAQVRFDDEILKMPVIGRKSPDASKVEVMPFLKKIEEIAENKKLVIILQDYITTGLIDGKLLPKNVIYIGQAVRAFDEKKVILNAFINPICYDYIMRALTLVT